MLNIIIQTKFGVHFLAFLAALAFLAPFFGAAFLAGLAFLTAFLAAFFATFGAAAILY